VRRKSPIILIYVVANIVMITGRLIVSDSPNHISTVNELQV
jgi:hypothetical protein